MASVAAGLFLSPARAAATAAFGFFVATALAGFGSGSLMGWNPLAYVTELGPAAQTDVAGLLMIPETWCIGASWVVAAVAQSLMRLRIRRAWDVAGAVTAAIVLVGGVCAAAWFDSGMTSFLPAWAPLVPTLAAGAFAVVLAVKLPCVPIEEIE